MSDPDNIRNGFKDRPWNYSYKTSSVGSTGRPVNILHDFYIPALTLSVQYDRVAGYFRSTSLAAASQGFSAFTAAGGKMRLVVGADLDEDDVNAILQGDIQRMSERLNGELEYRKTWPEEVARGVELLSWMVTEGYLEVRVAFRIDKNTGKSTSFTTAADGYVHEKWAVFKDKDNRRLYISGSLNESRRALVLNAENIDVHADWWGDIEKQRADEAELVFETIWNDQSPYLRVMTLPEAVRQKMIRIGQSVKIPTEIDGSALFKAEVEPPSGIERLKFALIKDGPKLPRGRYVGMETSPVEPWPHQEIVALRLIETWPYSYLLCDEVGLGKTIEAGLAFRSLYLSGLSKRILVSPPASLTKQWHREMASKFFLPFARSLSGSAVKHEYIFPFEETKPSNSLLEPDLCIVSTGLISRKDRHPDIQQSDLFDIILIDEAHYARRKNPKNGTRVHPGFGNLYKTISKQLRKRTKSLWLATATPMQIDWIEIFDLLNLTNRVGAFQLDPSLTWGYYEALGAVVRDQEINETQWELLRRSIRTINQHDPFLKKYLEEAVIDGRIKTTTKQWIERGRIPRGSDRRNIQRLIFSAAPLSRVMLRHTRPLLEIYRKKGQLGANLAKREILPVPRIVFNELEKQAYNELETYCKELTSQIAANTPAGKPTQNLGFYLSFLRLRFASSLYAIRETVRRRKECVAAALNHLSLHDDEVGDLHDLESMVTGDEDIDDDVLRAFLKNRSLKDLEWEKNKLTQMFYTLEDLSEPPSKFKALLNVLDNKNRKLPGGRLKQLVVFTRFYDTLQDIVNRLRSIDKSMLIGTYSGKGGQYVDPVTKQLRGIEREEIKHRFMREEIDILICTDAAAEGLNLQTADFLINYDLPWNPMKVEQRIGRIDRIGQRFDRIYVLNLCYADSAEQIVYDRLLKRLIQAGSIVGTQQISMLPVHPDEFNDLAAGLLTPEELEKRAKERIELQKRRTASMEIPVNDLYEIYIRLHKKRLDNPPPVDLGSIWDCLTSSKYLKDVGCTVSQNEKTPLITLRGIAGIPNGAGLTIDRTLYDQGVKELEGILHFASYGDPFFDQLLDQFETFDLPKSVIRLTEKVPETDVEVVAYVAAVITQKNETDVCLITSWNDLKHIQLNEAANLSEYNIDHLKKKLHDMVLQEFNPTRAVERLEKLNQCSATAQSIFNLIAARSLIRLFGSSENDNFWTIIKNLDELINERERLLIPNLPVEPLKLISKDLLFDIQLPQVAENTNPTIPIQLVSTAVDAACRIADAMKVKKTDLTVRMVDSRIEREIVKAVKLYKTGNF